jgi:hypothetical protein
MFACTSHAQSQFQFDVDDFKTKLHIESSQNQGIFNTTPASTLLAIEQTNSTFDQWQYSNKLFSSLRNYNLVIKRPDYSDINRAVINLEYLGKGYFEDYYEVYRDNLSKHLPQVPDANNMCIIY